MMKLKGFWTLQKFSGRFKDLSPPSERTISHMAAIVIVKFQDFCPTQDVKGIDIVV